MASRIPKISTKGPLQTAKDNLKAIGKAFGPKPGFADAVKDPAKRKSTNVENRVPAQKTADYEASMSAKRIKDAAEAQGYKGLGILGYYDKIQAEKKTGSFIGDAGAPEDKGRVIHAKLDKPRKTILKTQSRPKRRPKVGV